MAWLLWGKFGTLARLLTQTGKGSAVYRAPDQRRRDIWVSPKKQFVVLTLSTRRRVVRLHVRQDLAFGTTSLAAVPRVCPLNCISRAACLADGD